MTNALYAICLWAVIWTVASIIDKEHCESNGFIHGDTTILLEGYCLDGKVRIPAELIGRD